MAEPRRGRRACIGVSILAGVAAVLWWQRDAAVDTADVLRTLSVIELLMLVGCWCCWSLARTALHRLSLREATLAQSFVLAEVGEAAHSMPAGAASGIGARIAIGRSFGQDASSMSVSYIIVAEALSTGLWLLVLATSLRRVSTGEAGAVERGAIGLAVLGLLGTLLIAWLVIRPTRLAALLVRIAGRLQHRVARRWPQVGTADLEAFVDEVRARGGELVRRRWPALVLAGVWAVVASGLLLIAALRALSIDADLWTVWGGFALVTAAIGFAPTPGGVGIAEAGMTSMLMTAGAAAPEAVAAVIVHRGFTFVLPLITGSLAFAAWARWSARHRPAGRSDQ